MFDLIALQKFLGPLAWFLTLGKTETELVRSEISDLLHHTGQSVRTLIELEKTLGGLTESTFSQDTFSPIFLHCKYVFTGDDASQKARTHCTDIQRDVRRISFAAAKLFRTEWGEWQQIEKAFQELEDADSEFLTAFGKTLRAVDAELDEINALLSDGEKTRPWERYSAMREDIRRDVESMRTVIDQLRAAENHIRRVLT